MEQKKQMLSKIESLSEQEKLELFNVEELETRLEMMTGEITVWHSNGVCGPNVPPVKK